MWLSKQMKPVPPTADADMGSTTIVGENLGVITRGEVRALPVYGPGGYAWLPQSGGTVLVIKGGPGGEEQCVAGARQTPPKEMQPGEVWIYGPGGNSIYLRQDGVIALEGTVSINGTLMINGEPCACTKEGL